MTFIFMVAFILCTPIVFLLLEGAKDQVNLRYLTALVIQSILMWSFFRFLVGQVDTEMFQLLYSRAVLLSGLIAATSFMLLCLFIADIKNRKIQYSLFVTTLLIATGLFSENGIRAVEVINDELNYIDYGFMYVLYSIYFLCISIFSAIILYLSSRGRGAVTSDARLVFRLAIFGGVSIFLFGIVPDMLGVFRGSSWYKISVIEVSLIIFAVCIFGAKVVLSDLRENRPSYVRLTVRVLLKSLVVFSVAYLMTESIAMSYPIYQLSLVLALFIFINLLILVRSRIRNHIIHRPFERRVEISETVASASDKYILNKFEVHIQELIDVKDVKLSISNRRHSIEAARSLEFEKIKLSRQVFGSWLECSVQGGGERLSPTKLRILEILVTDLADILSVRRMLKFENDALLSKNRKILSKNKELEKKNQIKNDFISMASHQLRTPLSITSFNIKMLAGGAYGKVSDGQSKSLQDAQEGIERMSEVISELLDVARLNEGTFTLDKTMVDLSALVRTEVLSLRPKADEKGVHITARIAENITLSLDQTKARQVVLNFLDNALSYTAPDGHINVELAVIDDRIVFTVMDDGIGISKREQRKLFGKFERASNAQRLRPNGTGLGLYISKKIIEAHGGSIIFSSKINKGSTFGFKLQNSL